MRGGGGKKEKDQPRVSIAVGKGHKQDHYSSLGIPVNVFAGWFH